MKRSSGVRLCAAAVAGALSFALVTGCSQGDARHSGPASKALGAAELKQRIIARGEVPGFQVQPVPATRARPITTDSARCRPLARVMSGLPPLDAAAKTDRLAMENQKKAPSTKPTSLDDLDEGKFKEAMQKSLDRDVTTVTLASYDGEGAGKALESVRTAVPACASGFSAVQAGTKMKFTKVVEEKATSTGDGVVAFAATTDTDEGDPAPVHAEVVRVGNTLAGYFTTNLGSMMGKKAYVVSPAVVKAQQAKLK
ncbi:hypothetical protein [Streptomyces alanosinicus]|uniref:Lipoprotein n=1 Tax=Streptomyces alanosinicus TaxID=68171 RepID=A0A919D2R4_9ACTN|nr:hypothetical protein [Streptomyces alanosinicus]GHE04231.1 hypothetical protein GCM10010339_34770 [Streptomyces alanosinicus]